MREFKFRAWDEENKKLIQWHDDFFYDTSEITGYSGDFSNIEMPLMQYIGLKDKNGTEIYEGDIVKGTLRIDDWIFNQKVHYLNGCYMFGNWNAHEYFNKHTEIQVIGNIYENPELMEEKQ